MNLELTLTNEIISRKIVVSRVETLYIIERNFQFHILLNTLRLQFCNFHDLGRPVKLTKSVENDCANFHPNIFGL